MSAILELSEQLRDVGALIIEHERALASHVTPSLSASLRSLKKRMTRLEEDFAAVAARSGVDVCRYRFFADFVKPTVPPVAGALVEFQTVLTLAFNAIKNGPKQVARVTPDVEQQTIFGFGYSFSGSLGIVLTFDNKQLEVVESAMDQAMAAFFQVAKAKSVAEVASQGRVLGAPTIRAINQWARVHAKFGLGADIQWVRGAVVKNGLSLESQEIADLVETLNATSFSETETITVDGMIGGGEHVKKQAFHFVADDGTDYKGSYTDAISEEHPVQWPKRYRATIEKTTKVFYASDQEDKASCKLIRLEPI